MTSVTIAFIFMNILAAVVTFLRFYAFTKRNPRQNIKHGAFNIYTSKILMYAFDYWSELVFWLMFWTCASVFISYKLANNAFFLLPELGEPSAADYTAFNVVLFITLAARLMAILIKIVEQANSDIYIVDFEKPNMETRQVNAWRQIFVANEYSELMTSMRYVQPETLFVWFLFFWVGLGWKHFCETDPEFSTEHNPMIHENILLKFFMVGFLMFLISGGMFIVQAVQNIQGSAISNFVDLCTLANISMVFMLEHSFGYYLHAKTPWGAADIPLDWLQKEMQTEANGNSERGRGLMNVGGVKKAKYPVQTFQVYLPSKMREDLIRVSSETAPMEVLDDSLKKKVAGRGRKRNAGFAVAEDDTDPLQKKLDEPSQPGGVTLQEHFIKEDEHRKA